MFSLQPQLSSNFKQCHTPRYCCIHYTFAINSWKGNQLTTKTGTKLVRVSSQSATHQQHSISHTTANHAEFDMCQLCNVTGNSFTFTLFSANICHQPVITVVLWWWTIDQQQFSFFWQVISHLFPCNVCYNWMWMKVSPCSGTKYFGFPRVNASCSHHAIGNVYELRNHVNKMCNRQTTHCGWLHSTLALYRVFQKKIAQFAM